MKMKLLFLPIALMVVLGVKAQEEITISSIYRENKFSEKSVHGLRSMNDGIHYTILENSSQVVKYDYKNGEKQDVLFSLSDNPIDGEARITGYALSSDESKILLTTSREYIYRHSYISAHYIYDIAKKTITPVFEKKQQLAKIAPVGEKVAFVVENNLYVKDITSNSVTQVTYDGKAGEIINGMADWVYEEEFALKSAFEWSPDGKRVAFIRFDESHVKEFQMAVYGELYPEWTRFKYPKAGEDNSVVSVHVFDIPTGKLATMDIGEDTDIYIPRIKWTESSDRMISIRMNRLQNKADVLVCDAVSGESTVLYSEGNEKFVSQISDDFITFVNNGQNFIVQSEKSGNLHLHLYDKQGREVNAITQGDWEVDKLLGIDKKNKVVYYRSTEISPMERHVYRVAFNGKGKVKISEKEGMNDAVFSKSFDYYAMYNSSSDSPLEVTLYNKRGNSVRILEDNAALREVVKEYGFISKEFFSFNGPGGEELLGYMIKPANFDANKKYPVLMYVYGGPDSQDVLNEWDRRQPWFQMLAQKGYIVACVDNRGTDGRGEKFKKATYMQLGKLEVEDQVAGAEYLAALPYIDENRVGMFGWSYGGYMTLNCLMLGNHIFKVGISVAPVTNWRFYDTIYTERFMRKPQDNEDGYDDNSPLSHVEKLKGKLLLVHGSGDDNVHYQNSMMIAEELIQKDKQFEMMFYPNKNHGIYGGNTRYHLYTKMTNFLLENL